MEGGAIDIPIKDIEGEYEELRCVRFQRKFTTQGRENIV